MEKQYALKIVRITKATTTKQIEHLFGEKRCLMKLKRPQMIIERVNNNSVNQSNIHVGDGLFSAKNGQNDLNERLHAKNQQSGNNQFVSLLTTFSTKYAACFVMEYVDGMNLF